jgi:hypothetical protein
MKSVNESTCFLNCDGVLLNHHRVFNDLSKIVDWIAQDAKQAVFLALSTVKRALCWQNKREKHKSCFIRSQQ